MRVILFADDCYYDGRRAADALGLTSLGSRLVGEGPGCWYSYRFGGDLPDDHPLLAALAEARGRGLVELPLRFSSSGLLDAAFGRGPVRGLYLAGA